MKVWGGPFGGAPSTSVRSGQKKAPADTSDANLNAARFTNFADGLLGVADEIQENLNQLIGVSDDRGQIGLRLKIDLNVVTAKRMILQLEGALDEGVDVHRPLLRRGRPGKFEQVLNDARGAACLSMG